MTLTVRGEPADKLIGASTPLANATEMVAPITHKRHEHLETVAEIELDAHAPTVLQPQGQHFILKGVHHKLQPGQSFVMTLDFAKTGKHDITVHVVKAQPGDGMPELPERREAELNLPFINSVSFDRGIVTVGVYRGALRANGAPRF